VKRLHVFYVQVKQDNGIDVSKKKKKIVPMTCIMSTGDDFRNWKVAGVKDNANGMLEWQIWQQQQSSHEKRILHEKIT
jgi:hypothetical protein